MYFRSKRLCEALIQYKKIIIYGTGNFALQIYPQLLKGNLKDKIVCFTQTNGTGMESIDGIPVINFETLHFDKSECVVLIAVSELYTDEIRQTLDEHNYVNVIALTDYKWDCRPFEKMNQLNTFEEYCEYIADWYEETHADSLDKREIIEKLINRGKCPDKNRNSNLIVMICGHMSSRIVKILGALKRKKYDIIMLDYCPDVNSWSLDELQKAVDQIHPCACIEEMLYMALQYCPLVYFFEPRWGDCSWVNVMLKNKQYFGKVVMTLYDELNGYVNANAVNVEIEKYALEHVDGIVWRWFSKEYLESKGYRYQGKSIHFMDYCEHDTRNRSIDCSCPNMLKLCEIIGYGDEIVEKKEYDQQYMDYVGIGDLLKKLENRKDCIFHFYAGALSDENKKICEQYEKEYTNFKFFLGIEHSELLSRLEKYDYTCFLYTDGEEPLEETPIGNYRGSIYINGIRNTFFDCIYGGLSIITTNYPKLCEYLSEYDIVVKMNLSNLNIDYLKQNKEYYRANAEVARKSLDIDNHIQKLIDFFQEV